MSSASKDYQATNVIALRSADALRTETEAQMIKIIEAIAGENSEIGLVPNDNKKKARRAALAAAYEAVQASEPR